MLLANRVNFGLFSSFINFLILPPPPQSALAVIQHRGIEGILKTRGEVFGQEGRKFGRNARKKWNRNVDRNVDDGNDDRNVDRNDDDRNEFIEMINVDDESVQLLYYTHHVY